MTTGVVVVSFPRHLETLVKTMDGRTKWQKRRLQRFLLLCAKQDYLPNSVWGIKRMHSEAILLQTRDWRSFPLKTSSCAPQTYPSPCRCQALAAKLVVPLTAPNSIWYLKEAPLQMCSCTLRVVAFFEWFWLNGTTITLQIWQTKFVLGCVIPPHATRDIFFAISGACCIKCSV